MPLAHIIILLVMAVTGTLLPARCGAQARGSTTRITTGITGTLTASGLDNPRYVLSFPAVQHLMLDAAERPIPAGRLARALVDTPVAPDDLVRLGLLRREADGRYALDYLLLRVQDQREIRRVAEALGTSLAAAFEARAAEFTDIFAAYPDPARRGEVAFAVVAGMILNWEGLELTTELGLRAEPTSFPNGDRYIVHSAELGAELDDRGLYWGSHSFPGPALSFTTFGDGPSIPRRRGIPDVYFGTADEGLEALREEPAVHGAVRDQLLIYLGMAIADAGAVMEALGHDALSAEALAEATTLPAARFRAVLGLLTATGYVEEEGEGVFRATVPLLTGADRPLVDASLTLGRRIMRDWLLENGAGIRTALRDLSPMRNGVPFELAFSEVWHDIFGVATRALAASGFYADPRADGRRFHGYVPLVWSSSLYDMP